MESRYRRKDGQYRWFITRAVATKDRGRVSGWVGSALDIHEQMLAQQRSRFEASVLKAAPEAIISTDNDFRLTSWNSAAERYYGWTAAEVIGRPYLEAIGSTLSDEERQDFVEELKKGILSGVSVHTRKTGETFPISFTCMLMRDGEGNPVGVVASVIDLSERKKAEDDVLRDVSLLKAILRSTDDAISFKDMEGRFLFINAAMAAKFDRSEAEILGRTVKEIAPTAPTSMRSPPSTGAC
jgi:PAS domain S-box-containing protein